MNRAHSHHLAASTSLAIVAIVAVAGLAGCKTATSDAAAPHQVAATSSQAAPPTTAPAATTPPASSSPSPSASASPAPSATTTPKTTPTTTPVTKLKRGNSGPAVLHLQQQLTALGYWLGTPNGKFGDTTQQAVFALQKVANISPSGIVTAATQKALDNGVRPTARNKTGSDIEVDLKRDIVMFVTDGQVKYIINTSTGGGYTYYNQGSRNVAVTPKGHFTTGRTINGMHRSSLGLMYRPRYFNGGIAIHGDSSVPAHPVSHGCVRVSDAAMDWIWKDNLDPVGTHVWVF